MSDSIRGFNGEYRWLSNFAPVQVRYKGYYYFSVENAYQAAKFLDDRDRRLFLGIKPSEAKSLGRQWKGQRSDWEQVKGQVMLNLLRQKFRDPLYKDKLLATGDAYIEETNYWGDTYWGVCKGVGDNRLGQLIMQVREELRIESLEGDNQPEGV